MLFWTLFLCFVAFGAPKECEVDRHFQGLVEKFAKDEDNCNDQNFSLHLLCSVLVSRNFRKYYYGHKWVFNDQTIYFNFYFRGPYTQRRIRS